MMRTILIFLILALLAPAASAADVTAVPAGVSTEAVKAFRRGLELHKAKQWARAIPEYERAIELGGRFPEAFNNLAYCYRKTGRIEKAIADSNGRERPAPVAWRRSSSGRSGLSAS